MMNATYAKLKDETWGVRVPGRAAAGDSVVVERKDGTRNNEVVSRVLWTGEDRQKAPVSLCTIMSSSSDRTRVSSSSSYRGTCDECGESSSSLRACKDSSGIQGYCCSRCASQPSYDRSFM